MKKLFLLGFTFLITPVFAADFTPDSTECVQVIQHAVSPKGVCEIFATPCDVPADWKVISSCDLVKPKEEHVRFEDVQDRRQLLQLNRIRDLVLQQKKEAATAVKKTVGSPRFVGRALNTKRRGTENIRLGEEKAISHFDKRKTTALPEYDTEAYARFKELNSELMPGLKQEGELTELQKYQQRIEESGQRRPGWETSTQMKRTGYMDMTSYFSQRGVKNDPGIARHWRELHPQKRSKTERSMDTITNRKGWRGERMEGDLGGSLRD